MKKIYLPEVQSTNTWMLNSLASGSDFPDQTAVYTFCQTAGRGQVGNKWESEPNQNIALSLLLRPSFLSVRNQFVISQLCSLAIVESLEQLALCHGIDPSLLNLSVKWPNDIYAGDLKLGGILIENQLMGSCLQHCILGIGINVRQKKWVGSAPNPVSLSLLGMGVTPEEVLDAVCNRIIYYYDNLRNDMTQVMVLIQERYISRLYRSSGLFPYFDPERNEHFLAEIVGVDAQGPLIVKTESGEERRYWFKEIQFELPCGVTKE